MKVINFRVCSTKIEANTQMITKKKMYLFLGYYYYYSYPL